MHHGRDEVDMVYVDMVVSVVEWYECSTAVPDHPPVLEESSI